MLSGPTSIHAHRVAEWLEAARKGGRNRARTLSQRQRVAIASKGGKAQPQYVRKHGRVSA